MSSIEDKQQPQRREVRAELIEATPSASALGHWMLASPILLFLAWIWVDLFAYYSPIEPYIIDAVLAVACYMLFFVLPLGYLAHRLVTSLPKLFHHAGWDVHPLERVASAEAYTVSYRYEARRRAEFSVWRTLVRAAQGWVYLEIAAIFVGAVLMIPIYFSAAEFGFGR